MQVGGDCRRAFGPAREAKLSTMDKQSSPVIVYAVTRMYTGHVTGTATSCGGTAGWMGGVVTLGMDKQAPTLT